MLQKLCAVWQHYLTTAVHLKAIFYLESKREQMA